jgi:heat shock protein HtpX
MGGLHAEGQQMPKNFAALGITGNVGQLFASHPPMEARIAALQAMQPS